jgi:hypothetical protein
MMKALTARKSMMDLAARMAALANRAGRRRESERLRSFFWFAGSAALAGGVVLLFASPGRELRRRIGTLFGGGQDKIDALDRDRHARDDMANEGGGSQPRE